MGDDDLTTCYDLGICRPFIMGYNQAWLAPTPDSYTFHRRRDIFGRDMTTDFDVEGVALVMRLVRDSGGTAVRLWAFEGYMEGIVFKNFLASGFDKRYDFLSNVRHIMRIARNNRIKVYWTAFSTWFHGENPLNRILRFVNETESQRIGREKKSLYRNLILKIFTNEGRAQDILNDNIIRPFIQAISRPEYADSLFGLDIFNEIDYGVRDGFWTDWDAARRWISREVEYIHHINPNLKVTVSLACNPEGNLDHVKNLGLDLYDIHIYNDEGELPDFRRSDLDKPIIIGEFGQNPNTPYNDNDKNTSTRNFLINASRYGYAGAFAWRLIDWPRPSYPHTFYIPRFPSQGERMRPFEYRPRPAVEIIKNFWG